MGVPSLVSTKNKEHFIIVYYLAELELSKHRGSLVLEGRGKKSLSDAVEYFEFVLMEMHIFTGF